jgi:hypothetical protein
LGFSVGDLGNLEAGLAGPSGGVIDELGRGQVVLFDLSVEHLRHTYAIRLGTGIGTDFSDGAGGGGDIDVVAQVHLVLTTQSLLGQRLSARVREIIEEHQPRPLNPDKKRKVQEILAKAAE